MDWRQWYYEKISQTQDILDVIPVEYIFGSGSLDTVPPHKPFMVLRNDAAIPLLNDGDAPLIADKTLFVWIHDEPGSYARIDGLLDIVRGILVGQVTDAVACTWSGDSGDLADDTFKTITRNGSFRLVGGM